MNQTLSPAAVRVVTEMERLLTEKGWTQGALARNSVGHYESPYSPRATCYCLVGVLCAATGFCVLEPDAKAEVAQALNAASGPGGCSARDSITTSGSPGRGSPN